MYTCIVYNVYRFLYTLYKCRRNQRLTEKLEKANIRIKELETRSAPVPNNGLKAIAEDETVPLSKPKKPPRMYQFYTDC